VRRVAETRRARVPPSRRTLRTGPGVRRHGLAIGAGCLLSFVAVPARAQLRDEDVAMLHHNKAESPQNFAFEFRIGPYSPNIDSDPALTSKPYAETFGTNARVLVSAEFDWQVVRIPHLGTIGPGVGAGFTSMSGLARFTNGPVNGQALSGESTSLQIFPLYAVAVLRADVLWHDFGVPIVPYAKLGIGYALWRASNTLGTSSFEGVSGEGHSVGTHVALGLAFNLNPLDVYAARGFDDSLGVNNSYVFAEWTREDLTGLGLQTDPLRVGGTGWNFGLAFEF